MDLLEKLQQAHTVLRVDDDLSKPKNRVVIFVYTPPKCGSTSLVSSLRIAGASDKCTVLHLHNENMLRVLYNITDVTIMDLVRYNRALGKEVFVIDIFRTPIEQKLSLFFENIFPFHFNLPPDGDNRSLPMELIASRFNSVLPHLVLKDHFFTEFGIDSHLLPSMFDHTSKYLHVFKDNIHFVKLRLQDARCHWGSILSHLLHFPVFIAPDYVTEEKDSPVATLYKEFKKEYRIPPNVLTDCIAANRDTLSYYLTKGEMRRYLHGWNQQRAEEEFVSFDSTQYALYQRISLENQRFKEVDFDHYRDEGCFCVSCTAKRAIVFRKLSTNRSARLMTTDKVVHESGRVNAFAMNRPGGGGGGGGERDSPARSESMNRQLPHNQCSTTTTAYTLLQAWQNRKRLF